MATKSQDAKLPTQLGCRFFIWFSADACGRCLALRGRIHIRGSLMSIRERMDSAVAWSFWH